MQTANFSIVVLTGDNFTKQNTLETGYWMKSLKNLIEHTHFKKKNFKKFLIPLFLRELEASKVLVIVHNPEKRAMLC